MQGGKWVCLEEACAQAQSCPVEGLVGEQAGQGEGGLGGVDPRGWKCMDRQGGGIRSGSISPCGMKQEARRSVWAGKGEGGQVIEGEGMGMRAAGIRSGSTLPCGVKQMVRQARRRVSE